MNVENHSSDHNAKYSLSQRAARGSIWVMGGFAAQQFLRLGSNLILTRLLFPEAFGLMALVSVVMMGMSLFSDIGLGPNVVRSRRGDDPTFLDTVWTVQVIRGFGLWIIVCLLAFPLARFYEEPILAELIPVVGLSLVMGSLRSTWMLSLQRHLALGKLTIIGVTTQIFGLVVTITWAVIQPTVWALVAGNLAAMGSTLVLSHVLSNRFNRIRWDQQAFKELFHFGKWIFISTILTFMASQFDRLLFAKLFPMGVLGVYSIGAMLARFPEELSLKLAGSIVFPAFSRKMDSGSDLLGIFHKVRIPSLFLAGAAAVPLCASGVPLINILYDSRYVDAGWILQILAAGAWLRALEMGPGSAVLAKGLPNWLTFGHGAKLLGLGLFIPIGFWLSDFQGAVVGVAVSNVLLYAVVSIGAHRQGLGAVRSDLVMTAFAGLSVLGGIIAAAHVADTGGGDFLQFVTAAGVSSILWFFLTEGLARWQGQSLTKSIAMVLKSHSKQD